MGLPCYLGGMSRGLLGRNSRLQMRHRRKEALKDADFVILAGKTCLFDVLMKIFDCTRDF